MSEDYDDAPNGELQPMIDHLERPYGDSYDPSEWDGYDNEFDPDDV